MEQWTLKFSKQAIKDSFLLEDKGLSEKAKSLLKIVKDNPYKTPPPYEKLIGFENTYSRRINITHRLVYRVVKETKTVEVVSMFRHYLR